MPQPERRRRPRARAELAVSLTAITTATIVEARMKDLSELGLACIARDKLRMRTKVEATFALPRGKGELRVRGHVIRCEPVDTTGREHEIALAFTEVPPPMRAAIHGYVSKDKRAR